MHSCLLFRCAIRGVPVGSHVECRLYFKKEDSLCLQPLGHMRMYSEKSKNDDAFLFFECRETYVPY